MDETAARLEAYVKAALVVQGYRLDEAQTARVVEQFIRIEGIARLIDSLPLSFEANAAPVFRP